LSGMLNAGEWSFDNRNPGHIRIHRIATSQDLLVSSTEHVVVYDSNSSVCPSILLG
jgi:hypothetical protein